MFATELEKAQALVASLEEAFGLSLPELDSAQIAVQFAKELETGASLTNLDITQAFNRLSADFPALVESEEGEADVIAQINATRDENAELFQPGDLDDGETPAISFSLTESTDAVAEADAEASEYTVTAASAEFANAEIFSVTLPGAEGEEDTVLEINVSAATSGGTLATQLNGTTAFSNAGLSAEFSNGVLSITDANGRDLSESISLVDDGAVLEPSSVSATILNSGLAGVDSLRLMIDGEEVVLRDLADVDADTVATKIAAQLNLLVEGSDPYTAEHADNTLTITSTALNQFGNLRLLDQQGDSKLAITVPTADLGDVDRLVLTLDGGDEVEVDLSAVDWTATPATAIETAVDDAIETAVDDAITAVVSTSGTTTTVTLTDTQGRDFGAESKFIDTGATEKASVTHVGPLTDTVADEEVGQFSVTIGEGDDAIVLEQFDVDVADITELATALQTQLDNVMDGDDGNITVAEGTDDDAGKLVISDALGRGISNVYIGGAVDAEEDASEATIGGLTELLAEYAESFEITVGSKTYTIADVTTGASAETNELAKLAENLTTALQAEDDGRGSLTVAVGEDGQSLVISDASGRELSGAKLVDTDSDQPSIATVAGLSDTAVDLDLGYVSITFIDDHGAEQTVDLTLDAQDTLDALVTDLQTALDDDYANNFVVEGIEGKLVIQHVGGNQILSVSTLTGDPEEQENVLQVGADAVIVKGAARDDEDDAEVELGSLSIENSETGGQQALTGVSAEVVEAGVIGGSDAAQVGGDATVTAAVETEVGSGHEYFEGVAKGSDPSEIGGGFEQTQEGSEAVEGSAWTATLDVEFEGELEADYTFTLSLTEVLGEDAEEGAEANVVEFTLDAVVGQTAADVLAAMVDAIDADEAFAAALNEEGQLVVTAEAEATNYTVETGVELVAVEEPQIVEAA